MEKTNDSLIIKGNVNGFNYIQINNVKYFIGDFINTSNKPNQKLKIISINNPVYTNILFETVDNKNNVFLVYKDTFLGFYYKKDYKKYYLQKKSRIYENDPNTIIKDCYGTEDKLSNMLCYNGKLVSKTNCFPVSTDDFNITHIPKKVVLDDYTHFKECYFTNIYYHKSKLKFAHIAILNSINNEEEINSINFELKYVNNNSINKLLKIPAKYFKTIDSDKNLKISLINGEEFLKTYEKFFTIGPKSGMIIKKNKLKTDDDYCLFPNGYYFPEFNNLQSKSNNSNFNYKFGLDSNTHLISEGIKYTFGVEIEMADCCFPPHFFTDMNIKVEKDGSIKNTRNEKYGPEVITGVLKGDKGFEHLQYICTELAKRSEVNHTCGIHTHIGNANFNNANIIMLFKLAKLLENDIFNMLPASRSNNEYCRKLPNLNFNFDNCTSVMDLKIRVDNYYTELFTLAANCPPSDKYNKTKNHPKGAKVGYDHNNIRYCWINFIPALFNTRNTNPPVYTIEFRPFNASTNFIKIKNWVKICMAIVNFSENYHKDIINNYILFDNKREPITLKNVIRKVYPKSYRKLNEFIDSRTEIFSKNINDDIDFNSTTEKLNIKELIS